MPNRRLRPFKNKGDVKRMMQRFFATPSRDEETFDALTMAAFLAKGDRFPALFDAQLTLPAPGNKLRWIWWDDVSSMLLRVPTPGTIEAQPLFWNPGEGILPRIAPGGTAPEKSLTGWYLMPQTIVLQFFTSGRVRKAAHLKSIWSFAGYFPFVPGIDDRENLLLLGRFIANGTQEVQVYSAFPGCGAAVGDEAVQALFPFPLIPGNSIILDEDNGTAAGDLLRITMMGTWIFDPRFVQSTEERNG